jgi:hypothetical protein
VPVGPEDVPEYYGPAGGREIVDTDFFQALVDFRVRRYGLAQAGQVAFHIGQENRDANARKPFRQHLQRNGFPGSGGAGDQAVPIAVCGQQILQVFAFSNKDRINFTHVQVFPPPGGSVKLPFLSFLFANGITSIWQKRPTILVKSNRKSRNNGSGRTPFAP